MRKRRAGFTLLEIMMVLLILSVFSVVAIQGLHRGKNQAGAQGLATTISEELRRVRQEAMARRRPTAFCLPTDGGASPITRSYYVLDGEYRPRIVRSRNYKSEFAGANLFVGEWNLSSGSWTASPLPANGSKWNDFDFNNWVPATSNARNDNCFIFMPDGTVRTNGIHSFDKRYHILVSSGSLASGDRTHARLNAAGESYTISISPVGGVSMTTGILGENGSAGGRGNLATDVNFSAPRPDTVAPLSPDPLANQPSILPTPNPATLPPTDPPDALITKDQYVSLHMEAKSDSGEQLFCEWKLDTAHMSAPAKNRTSAFSIQGEETGAPNSAGGRMEWDQSLQGGVGAWRADWQWRPPVDAVQGERYLLTCLVQNVKNGGGTVEITKKFDIRPPGRIIFQSDRGPNGLYTMDESGQRERLYKENCFEPSATVDGHRMVFVDAARRLILHTPLDPTHDVILYSADPVHLPSISPNGNMVAFYRENGGAYILTVMKAGQGATLVTVPEANNPVALTGPMEIVKLAWTADGKRLLYPRVPVVGHPKEHLGYQVIDVGGFGQAVLGARDAALDTDPGFGGQVSSSTETSPGTIIITDNYGPYYDPWITLGGANEVYFSVGDEDASVERNPRVAGEFMITHKPVSGGQRQLHIVTWTPGTGGTGNRGGPLTTAGNNFHPVWTK